MERGHDISFSIDDLADKASPEPWDGKFMQFRLSSTHLPESATKSWCFFPILRYVSLVLPMLTSGQEFVTTQQGII